MTHSYKASAAFIQPTAPILPGSGSLNTSSRSNYLSSSVVMVKVLDNPVVALDILPGTKAQQDAITCSKQKNDEDDEDAQSSDEDEQNALAHAQYAATALSSTVSGTAKGLVDVTGDTVVGVFGIVAGVGKGLGTVAAHGGSAVEKAVGVGSLYRDSQARGLSREEVRKTEQEEKR